ncbi:hypothetical protein LUZ61_010731 [Rhynchospora tenuis]|uniref:Uncharacterized protein n=1 Tax=Rhynchospora tenuis TaxID=198213 RepID=A0AAD5ZZM9_9POAL|nr:hypothetical protein LUZ61_010731 [Rhynchospora tenuis]
MKSKRKSTIDDALRWDEPEEEGARCRKHVSSSQPPYSVCPSCLYDRLIRLCPDCAHVRPCPCLPSTSASSASSSFSSATGSGRGTNGSSVDKISNLIASEPAFARSKSAGFALMRSGSVGIGVGLGLERSRSVATGAPSSCAKKKRWRWAAIWPFKGLNEKGDEKKNEWRWWYFPSPIRVFTHRKSVS